MRCNICQGFTGNNTEQGLGFDLNVVQWMGGPNAVVDGFITMVNCCAKCTQQKSAVDFEVTAVEVPIAHAPTCHGERTYTYKVIDEERNDWHEPEHRARKWHMFGAKATIRIECGCGGRGILKWEDKVNVRGMRNCQTPEELAKSAVSAVK